MSQKFSFKAEVSRLLDLVTHALYSEKHIFLRELISNAADASDKLRYEALTKADLLGDDKTLKITITPNKQAKTLTIADNGIGMSQDELIENLGTIAQSGTTKFLEQLSGDKKKDMNLIGQFGVGFYAAFMVASRVEVHSRRAGEEQGHLWTSEGMGEFEIAEKAKNTRGTEITLTLKEDAVEFLEGFRLREIIERYSNHISLPIFLKEEDKEEQVNQASALWARPKAEITEEQYQDFYRNVAHQFDKPLVTLHYKAEGMIEYQALLFVPSNRPLDLFTPERKHRVKLYVKKVFITDQCEGLIPSYLRFIKGIVDSEDLPLNISREMLQNSPVLAKISSNVTKRILDELAEKAKSEEEYTKFWTVFGAVLKEGIYEDFTNRDKLLSLARFQSSESDQLISLDNYVEGMKPDQKEIYYLIGDSLETLKKSPQLEAFKAKGLNVLLMTDPVDDFWVPAISEFGQKKFQSITKGDIDLAAFADEHPITNEAPQDATALEALRAKMQIALQDKVKEVKLSPRLRDSACCLVADKDAMDIRLEKLLRQHQQPVESVKKILEINGRHPLISKLSNVVSAKEKAMLIEQMSHILYAEALLAEGEQLTDPQAFVQATNKLLLEAI